MPRLHLLLAAAATLQPLFYCVNAHSHMAKPLPARELHCRVGAQHGRDCPGPCPRRDDYGRLNHPISPAHPAETWARGTTVKIRWHRDNHDGTGFVRLALVPVHRMMDKEAHSKYAFHFTCMNRGPHHCYDRSYDVCGNDAQGMAWRTFVQVPTSYPDGIYVLGWSWYGGGDYKGDSFFGDYYSCSFIRIHGGVSVTNEFQPLFDGPKCLSATDRLGVCWKEPCHISQRVYPIIPAEFNGRRPSAIRRAELEHDMDMTTSQEDSEMISEASGDGDVSAGARGIGSRNHDNDRDGRKREEASSTQEKKTDEPIDTRVFSSGAHAGSLKVCFLDFATWNKVPIHDGGVYLSRDFPRGVTVEAFYNGVGDVNYVDFLLDDKMSWREKSAPYVLNGNKGQHIRGWTVPLGRTIKIEVVVMTKSGHSEIFEADVFFK